MVSCYCLQDALNHPNTLSSHGLNQTLDGTNQPNGLRRMGGHYHRNCSENCKTERTLCHFVDLQCQGLSPERGFV
jgi:hypothetical protein